MTGHPARYRQRSKRAGRLVERSRMHGIQRGRRLLQRVRGVCRNRLQGKSRPRRPGSIKLVSEDEGQASLGVPVQWDFSVMMETFCAVQFGSH